MLPRHAFSVDDKCMRRETVDSFELIPEDEERGLLLTPRRFTNAFIEKLNERSKKFRQTNRWLIFLSDVYIRYGLSHFIKVIVLVAYSFLGALVFWASEHGYDQQQRDLCEEKYNDSRRQLTERIWELRQEPPMSKEKIIANAQVALDWYDTRVHCRWSDTRKGNNTVPNSIHHWDFWSALLYAGTIYTTIGKRISLAGIMHVRVEKCVKYMG